MSEPRHLNNSHRDTLLQIFQRPESHNIEWRALLSLFEAVGSVVRRADGKYRIAIGDETEVVTRPKHKDVDPQLVRDARRMLTDAGYAPIVAGLEAKGTEV